MTPLETLERVFGGIEEDKAIIYPELNDSYRALITVDQINDSVDLCLITAKPIPGSRVHDVRGIEGEALFPVFSVKREQMEYFVEGERYFAVAVKNGAPFPKASVFQRLYSPTQH